LATKELKGMIGEKYETDKKGSFLKGENYALRRCDLSEVE